MQRSEIAGTIRAFLEREFPNPGVELGGSTSLLDEWFVDSLGIVETILFLEQAFDVKVSRADVNAENFRCIDALAAFVARKSGSAGAAP